MFEFRGHLQIATPRASPAELEKKKWRMNYLTSIDTTLPPFHKIWNSWIIHFLLRWIIKKDECICVKRVLCGHGYF